MARCDTCGSKRILGLHYKDPDGAYVKFNGVIQPGVAIEHLTNGEQTRVRVCLECGKAQGSFPIEDPEGFGEVRCSECGSEPPYSAYVDRPCRYRNDVTKMCPGKYVEVL